MSSECTVGKYIGLRLREIGVEYIFGVPGDYAFDLHDALIASGLNWVGATHELNAAYAADAYARCSKCCVGAVTWTYGVGALGGIGAIAGSYAEGIPVCAITGMRDIH